MEAQFCAALPAFGGGTRPATSLGCTRSRARLSRGRTRHLRPPALIRDGRDLLQ